jgi:hypothetical protein
VDSSAPDYYYSYRYYPYSYGYSRKEAGDALHAEEQASTVLKTSSHDQDDVQDL